ncbi:phage/plasmid primase, P4 family, partial [Listeria monocytogenes]
FFVMTGQVIDNYRQVNEATSAIQYLHTKYIGTNEVRQINNLQSTVDLPVSDIIQRAERSKQGAQFKTLYDGLWDGLYPSQSEADLAFANMLAFWTGCNAEKMDEIFRSSGLYRTKWDQKRGAQLYGEMVINKAIANTSEVYQPGSDLEGYSITVKNQNRTARKVYGLDDTGNAERFRDKF